jgi:hypothetical protein
MIRKHRSLGLDVPPINRPVFPANMGMRAGNPGTENPNLNLATDRTFPDVFRYFSKAGRPPAGPNSTRQWRVPVQVPV